VVIPNGADLGALEPVRSSAGTGTLIASVGRLEAYKGHHRILAAFPAILEQVPDARLWIAGVGPYEEQLRRQASALGVADRVDIRAIPASDRQAMANELAKTSLVVLLSEYETHPIAVLEALALRRPVLVADTSGLSELANRGWARAVPLRSDPATVAVAVLDQLRQPLIPQHIELPTWDRCAAELLSLYHEVSIGAQSVSMRPEHSF
jgi:glycogen synthase